MHRQFFALLFLLTIGIGGWSPRVFPHDAFYPHHRDDFESMTRRRALRGTVLLSTAVFLCVLGGVVYLALRKNREVDEARREEGANVEDRMATAANRAAAAAREVLSTEPNIVKAAEVALTTYAAACGVTWQSRTYRQGTSRAVPYNVRCKIGTDIVTLRISPEVVQLKAAYEVSKARIDPAAVPKPVDVVLPVTDQTAE